VSAALRLKKGHLIDSDLLYTLFNIAWTELGADDGVNAYNDVRPFVERLEWGTLTLMISLLILLLINIFFCRPEGFVVKDVNDWLNDKHSKHVNIAITFI
jgi:hypothetical protein